MPLKIYNSLTKQKEEFIPLKKGEVKMYVCGPTVYDEPHIGHLRSAYVFEVIRNYFEYSGYKVTFVRNVTDVDDKIIDKAKESGNPALVDEVRKVSKKYYDLYKEDLDKLGIKKPSKEPKATEHIEEMIQLIRRLIDKEFAYLVGGDVYFKVGSFQNYGKLSGQKKELMLEGARIGPGENKKDALDFALWKGAKEGEPAWDSPWGKGRPGWHIECSAMSMKYLGESFDIHGGGLDLIFPHHENEIAQSESATGKSFAKYWLHHGLVTREGHKMSKSLHNFVTLKDLESKGPNTIEELKFLFLGTRYRMPLDYSEEKMKMEKAVRERFFFFLQELSELKQDKKVSPRANNRNKQFEIAFKEAMDDDFNTPQALAVMHEMVHYARKPQNEAVKSAIGEQIRKMAEVLGVRFPLMMHFREEIKLTEEVNIDIERLVEEREAAKKKKDFKIADEIRNKLLAEGIALMDKPGGKTTWRKI